VNQEWPVSDFCWLEISALSSPQRFDAVGLHPAHKTSVPSIQKVLFLEHVDGEH